MEPAEVPPIGGVLIIEHDVRLREETPEAIGDPELFRRAATVIRPS